MSRSLGKIAALAVAYAVALNLILPVLSGLLSPTMAGVGSAWALCSGGDPAPAKGPERPQPACPAGPACALPPCTVGLSTTAKAAPARLVLLTLLPRPQLRPPARFELDPGHPARGPPELTV